MSAQVTGESSPPQFQYSFCHNEFMRRQRFPHVESASIDYPIEVETLKVAPAPPRQFPGEAANASGGTRDPLRRRAALNLSGRRRVARYFAIALVFSAAISSIPAVIECVRWNSAVNPPLLARWIYLLFFFSFLQIAYACLLVLLPDWSTLRVTSWFLLVCCCCQACLVSVLALAGPQGWWTGWLQLSPLLRWKGVLWILAVVCLDAILSYLTYRESSLWRRTEHLFHQLFGPSPGAPGPHGSALP